MEFWRYYRIIRRRRWLILLGMAICVGLVTLTNYRAVPEYRGRTTVMETKGMSNSGTPLFPEQFMQLDVQLRLSNLGNIATSQKVMQNAYNTLSDMNLSMSPDEILSATSVQPVKDTNILAIEVTLPAKKLLGETREAANKRTRQEAMLAADVVASEFKRVYGDLNNSAVRQSREFIEAQLTTTRKSMVAAQNAMKDFKEKYGIVELDVQSQALVQRLQTAKTALAQANAAYSSASARAVKQGAELKGLPAWEKVSETTGLSPEWQQLQQQLIQFESQKAGMLAKPGQSGKGVKHPDVIALTSQIDEIKQKLASEAKQQYIVSSSSKSKNQVQQQGLDRWITAKVDEMGTRAQVDALSGEVARIESEMAQLPAEQAKYAELQADVQSATQTYALMRNKLDEAKIREQQAQNEVALKTVDPANARQVDNKAELKLILAFLLSPLLGIGVSFLLYYTDNTVKTAADAEKLLGMPVLCGVPESKAHSFARQKCPEIMDVAYQMLTSNLWIASQNNDLNGVVIVSAEPNVGRSVTASNLAIALAREGARVVLVDSDLRQPTQHSIFGADNKVGLTNLLSGGASLEDVLVPTKVPGLLLVPTGPIPDNPVKLLRSAEMQSIDEQIKDVADFVIYDTPAGVTFPDPVLVAARVGAAIVVHSAGRVPRGSEADLHARLASVGVQMVGAVLNKVKRDDSSSYFHYRRSYEGIGASQLPGGKKTSVS